MPDGSATKWDLMVASDAVAVVALTEEHDVILARQYRPGPGVFLNELPGGEVDEGESPAEAAARELREETGFEGDLIILGHSWQGANITRRKWAALATDCRALGKPCLELTDEFCETLRVSMMEFRELVRSGQLTDAWAGYRALDHLGLLG